MSKEPKTPSDVVLEKEPGSDIVLVVVETMDGTFTIQRTAGGTLGHQIGLAVGLMRASVRGIKENLDPEAASEALKAIWDQIIDDFEMASPK